MKVTKKLIDDTTAKYLHMMEVKAEFAKAEKAYTEAITPILDYVDKELKLPADKAAELKGHHTILEIGRKREIRKLMDPVEALRRLEGVEKGLGYANISLTLRTLEENLALREYEDLLEVAYGKRNVKALELD